MAATGNVKWETVGKTTKKTKTTAQNGTSKAQKKTVIDKMPTLGVSRPVQESTTIYQAFLPKEKEEQSPQSGKSGSGNGAVQSKKGQQSRKPKQSGAAGADRKDQPSSLEEAVKCIDLGEMENVLARVQVTFPDNPSVWLKDLASMLNLKMDKVPEPDPVFSGKPLDYPLCLLPPQVKKLVQNTIRKCSTQTLEHFLDHCIQTMIADMSRNISTYGFRIFAQALLHDKPDLMMSMIPKMHELLNANQSRPLRCLSLLWMIGQTGVKNLQNGLQVWYEFMFPVLSVRALSAYSVEYLEGLLRTHQNLKPAMNSIKPKEFLSILNVVYTPQPSLPSALHKRLQATYPKLKTIAFGSSPESQLRQFFPMFLDRCTSPNKSLQSEALSSLVTCLSVDKSSFSEWRKVYTKNNLSKFGVLLNHLCTNWENVDNKLDRKLLKETIKSCVVTNEEMEAKTGSHNAEGLQDCTTSCKELLVKMSRAKFPWRWLFFFIFAVIGGVVAYDVHSKGFKHSKTNQLLTDTGILVFLEQVWKRIEVYSSKAFVWLQKNVPYYYTKACEFAGPYLQLFWEKLYDLGLYIVEVTKPVRAWLNEKIPQLLEWIQVNFPWVWQNTVYYLGLVWQTIVKYSLFIWGHIVHYANIAGTWLLENVFTGSLSPENILATLSSLLAALQSYIVAFMQWCSNLVSGNPETVKQQ